MWARKQFHYLAMLRRSHRLLHILTRRYLPRRGGRGEAGRKRRQKPMARAGRQRPHALRASTNMRPFISMCIAWQNQVQ